MIEAKKQIVQEVLKKYTGPVEEFEFVKAALLKMSLEELQQYAQLKNAAIKAAEADDRILELQAARAADRAWHEYEMSQSREPQRQAEEKAQLERDRRTFQDAAKALRTFGATEANFNVVRQALGSSFSVSQIQHLLIANPEVLSGPTQQELNDWERERIERHNAFLKNADLETLRRLARQQTEQNRQRAVQEQAMREDAARAERDRYQFYLPIPETFQGQPLDSQFIKRCSAETLKQLIKLFGASQVTARLRGEN
jgi:hypothetical protein